MYTCVMCAQKYISKCIKFSDLKLMSNYLSDLFSIFFIAYVNIYLY